MLKKIEGVELSYNGAPHSLQDFAPSSFKIPHFWHRTTITLSVVTCSESGSLWIGLS